MSELTITKTTDTPLTQQQRDVLNTYLLGIIDGASEADKKSWRKFWAKVRNLEPGELFLLNLVFPRNSKFHRKFFALLNFGFESWDPPRSRKTYKGREVTKNFERFRREIVILAGFYEQTFDLKGRMHLEASSISFANMDNEEFEEVYSRVADVLLAHVFTKYKGRPELDRVMEQLVGFLR